MAWNLFIAYDLMSPGQNYDAVRKRINDLGPSYQFQLSLYYVSSNLNPGEAFTYVSEAIDANDRLAVIDAQGGVVSSWDRPPIDAINTIWFEP